MKKNRIFIIVVFLITLSLILFFSITSKSNDTKIVFTVPPHFIALSEVENDGILRYVFWETQISLLNADNICVYQTNIYNADFIVTNTSKYYINGLIYKELIKAEISIQK